MKRTEQVIRVIFKLIFLDCGVLNRPLNGSVTMKHGTTFGQIARYSCEDGFNLIGNETLICSANGSWSREEPVCKVKGIILLSVILVKQ